jgi:hypothetical protein
MNRKMIAIILVVLIAAVSTTIYLSMTGRIQKGEKLDIQNKAQNIQEEVQAIQKATEREISLITQFDPDNDSQMDGLSEDYMDYFGSPETLIEYVFGTLILNDADLFVNAFDPNTLLNDLNESSGAEEKNHVIQEMMNRLSRNGKLMEVNLINSKKYSDHAEARVLVIYEDKKEVEITMEFSVYSDPHDDSHPETYYVSSSIWDLIKQIEQNKTQGD